MLLWLLALLGSIRRNRQYEKNNINNNDTFLTETSFIYFIFYFLW